MQVVYVAGKYRDPRGPWYITKNIEAASEVALSLWQLGFAVLCPHRNTALFDGAAPDSVWLAGDLELQRRCDVTVMLPRWEESSGACAEHAAALAQGQPVYYWPEDREALTRLAQGTADGHQ